MNQLTPTQDVDFLEQPAFEVYVHHNINMLLFWIMLPFALYGLFIVVHDMIALRKFTKDSQKLKEQIEKWK